MNTENQRSSFLAILSDPVIRSLILVVFVVMTGLGIVLPTLALYARSFGVGYSATGVLLGAFGFTRLFGDLGAGSLIAWKSERWTGAAGMLFLAICATVTGIAPNYPFAVIAWGCGGIGSAVVFASLFSYILRAAPEGSTARTLSYFFAAFNVGIIAGGAAGGILADRFGLAAPLFAYAGLLVAGAGLWMATVPPLAPLADSAEGSRRKLQLREMLRIPGFPTAIVLNLTYLWVIVATFDTLIPLFAHDELGASKAGVGVLYAIAVAAEFLVLFPAGSFADRFGRKRVLVPGLAGLIVMIVVLPLTTSTIALGALLVLFAFTTGFSGVPPAAVLSDVIPSEHSGRAVGYFRFCGDVGFFLGPLVAGASSSAFGFRAAFAITAVLPVIALLLTLRTPETLKSSAKSPLSALPAGREA
ncbi:MAG: MFS transporter [Actinomycetota bacterium]|nr:MFS transporter [Actinomycetota bacterium]